MVYKGTPNVLLICKQVYLEAREMLKKQGISFHHGLLDICGLDNLMNTSILSNIQSLTIDAKGHEMLPKAHKLLGPSWRGHLDLIVDISVVLAKGHRLKNFTLDFTDPKLHAHVHECWTKPIRCDFRDQLAEALEHLRKIRGVGNVKLIGIPPALAADLKQHMESTPRSLLDMPGEVRNLIYSYAADWSDISTQITRTMKAWVAADDAANRDAEYGAEPQKTDPTYSRRSTPTILLLNKQIHAEAKGIVHAKPLRLTLPEHPNMAKTSDTLNALKFITPATLAHVAHLHVHVASWEWTYSLDRLLPQLAARHRLRTLTFTFRDALKRVFLQQGKKYPDHTLHLSLSGLAAVRGVGAVTFAGDLPEVYTAPLKMIMEGARVEGERLPALKAIREKWVGGVKGYEEVPADEQD